MPSVRNVRQIGVFIADPGLKPTVDDYDPTTIPIRWGVVAGSSCWHAQFVSNLARQARRIENAGLQTNATRQVEIWEIDPSLDPGDIRIKPLFWGEITRMEVRIGSSGEQEILIARMEPYHFGSPLHGQLVLDRVGVPYTSNIPIEFNPMVDGKIVYNRWKPTGNTDDHYHWIDPESTRSARSLAFADGGGSAVNEEWDLATICLSLSWIANAAETHIQNLPVADYATDLDEAPPIRNLVLESGHYLPLYLDAVTQKHKYNWTVDQQVDPDNTPEMKPRIRFFQQQAGTNRTVKIQGVGAVIDLDLTNASDVSIGLDVSALSNIVKGYGSLIEREMTIPLHRTWAIADDANEDHEDPSNHIGRKWAANEAGDYQGLRGSGTEPDVPPDLGATWMVKRRVVEDCLTLRDDKRSPPFVEYREDTDSTWKPIPTEWGYRVLHDEIGVWFTGQREDGGSAGGIPEEVLTDTVELRITGTIRGDDRITHTTSGSAVSPNSNDIETVVDLSDRYFDRQRQSTGTYASVLTGTADVIDDTTALTDYIDTLRETSELAAVNASITLFGLHFDDEYKIGDLVTKIEGREIDLNRSTSDVTPKYPQIVGIEYVNQIGQQLTILTLSALGVA